MKVYLPIKNNKSGSNLFFKRLAKGLSKLGLIITSNAMSRPDIAIFPITLQKTNSKVRILRLDSVYHDKTTKYRKRNLPILKSFKKADGVIYQGKFSKLLCDKYLGESESSYSLIGNGVDLTYYNSIVPVERKYDHIFLTSSRWRPQKRLVDIMESFLLADIKGSILYVAGDIFKNTVSMRSLKRYFSSPKIKYLGYLSQSQLTSYLLVVKAFIHLSWFDCCPNSVVEAIGARAPVITNNVGGTRELVEPSGGIVLNIDEPYDLEPCDLYHPPKIDRSKVAEAILSCCTKKFNIENKHVDINSIAMKYKDFFSKFI